MNDRDKLVAICEKALMAEPQTDERFKKRLDLEMKEVDAQNEHSYFLELHEKKARYPDNQHNLLIPYLLGLVKTFSIASPPAYSYGEFPDIDVDYLPMVRDYLKNEWAPKTFGAERVSNIGSYNTFGIKSALQSMARVFGNSRHEIVDLTTQLGLKDEDGKPLTWEKALEMYPALKTYCEAEANKGVAEAARRLINRNNSMGKHAGGLIVSSTRIDNFVPLVKDKDGTPLSAWVEGLHGQDLGPMGLVKFDLLVITNLMQIAIACRLIKERHGIESICAHQGQSDWSDTAYLNDPKSLDMANRGQLKCIFQFDSDGIRSMATDGGVTSFNDLVAYSALYRPGPMQCGMHTTYINRKRGKEEYTIHPKLRHILDSTYGVICYQEQCMQMLNVVGDIPLKDCEILRKAISKKNEEYFAKYKEMFVVNGQKNLDATKEEIEAIWNQLAAFAAYAFNKSHSCAYSYISARLLWLKVHYPMEFFAAVFSCEDASEKLKEYKLESERQGVCLKPVDINRSGVKFQIRDMPGEDSCIYFGLSNIKGIGEAVAQRIVDGQPYKNFHDFLCKFGTDASVLKPLVGLRVFDEKDPITLYKYYEWFKKEKKKREDRQKRYGNNTEKMKEELQSLVPTEIWDHLKHKDELFSERFMSELLGHISDWNEQDMPFIDLDITTRLQELAKKYNKATSSFQKKLEADMEVPGIELFNPDEAHMDEKLVEIYSSIESSERQFYGFLWTHPLERSPDYEGDMTFESFRQTGKAVGNVEVRLEQVSKMTSKKGTTYWLLKAEDANGEIGFTQVWSDDWERFAEDLTEGQLCRIQLKAPDGGFKRYTLDSPPRHKRHTLPKSKEYDFRVVILKKGDA